MTRACNRRATGPRSNHPLRATLLGLLVSLVCSASGSAQTSLSGPATSVLFDTEHLDDAFTIALDPDTTKHIRPTYWKEGALIGGIVGAIPGALLGHDLCETDDNPNNNCFVSTLLGAFGGAILMGLPGALIGGAFPKHEIADTTVER